MVRAVILIIIYFSKWLCFLYYNILHNVTTFILNPILNMLGDIFCLLFYINGCCIVDLPTIISYYYLLCLYNVLFDLLCVVVLALSFCHTLHIYTYFIVMGKKTNSWTVVGSSSLDQKTLSLLFFFFLLSVKYLTYLTGFHCPVDSLSSHNPNVVCPRLNAEHSSIIGWSYNGDEFRLWSILCDCPSTFSKWLP